MPTLDSTCNPRQSFKLTPLLKPRSSIKSSTRWPLSTLLLQLLLPLPLLMSKRKPNKIRRRQMKSKRRQRRLQRQMKKRPKRRRLPWLRQKRIKRRLRRNKAKPKKLKRKP